MGQPIQFDGCNTVMRAPDGAENVQDMHVFRTRNSCVSCWTLSAEELADINRTGRVFLSVLMGGQQPPVYVGSEITCREVLMDFGPVWPMAPRQPDPPSNSETAGIILTEWERERLRVEASAKLAVYIGHEIAGMRFSDREKAEKANWQSLFDKLAAPEAGR